MFAEDDGGEKKDLTRRDNENQKPGSSDSGSHGYPSGSGYPDLSQTKPNDKPATASGGSGYPAGSGYPDSTAVKPASNPSGYPSGSGYPAYPSANSGYPSSGSGYPSYPGADQSRRTTASVNNANNNYPGSVGGYPNNNNNPYVGYPSPQGQYPAYNPNYPPPQGNYNPNYPPPQGNYNSNYPPSPQGGYNQQGYGPPTTKKPTIKDQLTNFAKNLAKQVLTQAIIDKVSGRN